MTAMRDLAAADLAGVVRAWRIWWLLGIGDVRQRYARSALGPFWITISI